MNSNFSIDLPKLEYLTGDTVRGKLVFEVPSDKRIHGIHIHFYGSEFCEYSLLSDIPFRKKWVLDGTATVYGNKIPRIDPALRQNRAVETYRDEDCLVIKAGKYSWPFSFKIPKNIPPSCEFRNGKIRIEYILTAFITVPWGRSATCKKVLTIGHPYIIDPQRAPSVTKKEKTGIIQGELQVGGYRKALEMEAFTEDPVTYPGGKIMLHVKAQNYSGKTVKALKIKLRRQIFYGTSSEKQTVVKLKHVDKQFPLGQGKWSGFLPIVVPAIDTKPTVLSATLCKVNYYLSVRAKVHVGSDLIIRVPISVSSFSPTFKLPDIYDRDNKKDNKEKVEEINVEENKEKPPHSLMDLDWDSSPSDNNLPAPLQPMRSSLEDDSDDSDNEEDVVKPKSVYDDEYQRIHGELSNAIAELESMTQVAAAGLLAEVLGSSCGKVNQEQAKQHTIDGVETVDQGTTLLWKAIWNKSEDSFMEAVRFLANSLKGLSHVASIAAAKSKDSSQQTILQRAKDVLIAGQQSIIAGKESVGYDPFSASTGNEYTNQILELAIKGVSENSKDLLQAVSSGTRVEKPIVPPAPIQPVMPVLPPVMPVAPVQPVQPVAPIQPMQPVLPPMVSTNQLSTTETSKALVVRPASAVAQKIVGPKDIPECTARINQALELFGNPFFDQGNANATLDTLEKSSQNLAQTTAEFLNILARNCNQGVIPQPVEAKPLAAIAEDLLSQAKGVAQRYPSICNQLLQSAQTAALATKKLLDVAALAQNQSTYNGAPVVDMLHETSLEIYSMTSSLAAVTAKTSQEVNQQVLFEEEQAEKELLNLAKTIERATEQVKAQPVQQMGWNSDSVLGPKASVSNVASAVSQLLNSVYQSQHEYVRTALPGSKLNTNTSRCLEQAKEIAQLVEDLVNLMSAKDLAQRQDEVESLAKAINAATAHLVSAHRARGDPTSKTYQLVMEAAKMASAAIQDLLRTAQEVAQPTKQTPITTADPSAMSFRNQLETYARIAKLEKELESARQDLINSRKAKPM